MSALAHDRPYIRAVGDEPLPGYRLIAPLGMGGFGEVWKCLAPGGLHKAIKFVHEEVDDQNPTEPSSLQQEYSAFERVKSIRHPFLLTLERVELNGGELVMVMELADRSLGNRYDECRAVGLPGIPRSELLAYMVDAAEALDVLGLQHGLQHLDVKPANLFILGGHVKVGDYGLVARHKTSQSGEEVKLGRGLTPKYVAPEILSDRVDARSDQYPLALVYQELLTGVFPYSGRTARQLLLQHASAEPDVSPLPIHDQETVSRALSKDPALRYSSCLSFVKSLIREDPASGTKVVSMTTTTRQLPTEKPVPSAPSNLDVTRRLHPLSTPSTETREPDEHELEFNVQHPGWTYVAEWQSTPRGRVVRVSDTAGDFHFMHLLKLPEENSGQCEPIIATLADSAPTVFQCLLRPHAGSLSFAVPERHTTLKEWFAKWKVPEEAHARRTQVRALLTPVAMLLDGLHAKYNFAHGLLSPSTLLQKGRNWGVTLFGLGELLRRTRSDADWVLADAYAAPEAAGGQAVIASDQHSLALIFLELCGAWAPSDRRANRPERSALAFRFNRDLFTEQELSAVKKAMAAKPENRFSSCAAFLAALRPPVTGGITLEEVRAVECVAKLFGREAPKKKIPRPERLTNAIQLASGANDVASWPSPKSESLVLRLSDGRMTSRFPVKLTNDLAVLKLVAFKDQHKLTLVKYTADTYVIKPAHGATAGAVKGVELVVQLPTGDQASAGEVSVTGRATGGGDRGKTDETVILLIEQFRRTLQNTNERRKASRFRAELPIQLFPINDELGVQAPVSGKCADVSATGFACALEGVLAMEHVFVTFPTVPDFAPWALLAKVVRTQADALGNITVACRFAYAGT